MITSNYGEAGALEHLAPAGHLPPVISGHNDYHLWGPDGCHGPVLITVGFPLGDLRRLGADPVVTTSHTCPDGVPYEPDVPIAVVALPPDLDLGRRWASLRHFD